MKRTKSMIYKPTEESRELSLYAENSGRLWEMFLLPILDNLKKHAEKGNYNHDRAIDSLYNYMTIASNAYKKEFGYSFSVGDRFTAATELEQYIYEEYIA
jgi:hypothetical protein